jgi:hypothetical protein
MSSPYDDLIDQIAATGISRKEAEYAARRCTMAMLKNGVVGYGGAGLLTYFLRMSPGPALVGFAVGAGYGFVKSPQCSEVREAIRFWNTAPL